MDTQNTPIHVKLWHKEFWMMAFANLLLMTSIYMLVPALPPYLLHEGFTPLQVGALMGSYGIGVFLLGCFCSYLIQRYRRNHVCQYSIIGVAFCIAVLYYLDFVLNVKLEFWMILCTRVALGALLGLAQMTLSSTLVIDTCESFQRTEANHSAAWFARLALAVGPLVSILTYHWFHYASVLILACAMALVSFLLITLVKFPFKAPSESMTLFSLDRFFLPQGFPLFINLTMITTVIGLVLAMHHSGLFFEMMIVGFVLAMLAEKYAFADADLKSEIITGLILLGAAELISLSGQAKAIDYICPTCIGFSTGIIGSRFLLFYLKLAKHCQRGTSQSSFFLSWELGVSLGLFIGISQLVQNTTYLSLDLIMISMLFYNFFVHPWYIKHKNR